MISQQFRCISLPFWATLPSPWIQHPLEVPNTALELVDNAGTGATEGTIAEAGGVMDVMVS